MIKIEKHQNYVNDEPGEVVYCISAGKLDDLWLKQEEFNLLKEEINKIK